MRRTLHRKVLIVTQPLALEPLGRQVSRESAKGTKAVLVHQLSAIAFDAWSSTIVTPLVLILAFMLTEFSRSSRIPAFA